MKKLSLTFFAYISLLVSIPFQPTHAGIVIGAISGNALRGAAIGAALGGGAGTFLTISGAIQGEPESTVALLTIWAYLTTIGGVAGATLDVDATLPTDQLILGCKKVMPFIDNHEGFDKLAGLTKERFRAQSALTPEAHQILIRLSRTKLADALDSVDLSQEQFESVVRIFE